MNKKINKYLEVKQKRVESSLFSNILKLRIKGWNKKGFEYLEDIGTFLFVVVVLLGSIGFVLWIFYSVGSDVRGVEAETLGVKLIDSVVENGNFKKGIFEDDFDVNELMKRASVDKDIINNGDFYFNLGIYKNGGMEKEFKQGKGSFDVSCKLEGSSGNIPVCYEGELVVFNEGEKFVVKVLTGSNQEGGRI